MPATSTTEGQPKTILGEEAHGTQMTAPDTAGAGGPQFTESDNKDIHRYIILNNTCIIYGSRFMYILL